MAPLYVIGSSSIYLGRSDHISWSHLFGVGSWMLWNWRNKSTFDVDFARPVNPSLVILKSFHLYVMSVNPESVKMADSSLQKSWQPPIRDWVKLNVDGVVSPVRNRASCGGVLRDSFGVGLWVSHST
ncbi:hypothetical protein K1719_031415 [Acacia pycnantha]|nr:hypothetical protein K1719_031415 [Acacia pycnantha]